MATRPTDDVCKQVLKDVQYEHFELSYEELPRAVVFAIQGYCKGKNKGYVVRAFEDARAGRDGQENPVAIAAIKGRRFRTYTPAKWEIEIARSKSIESVARFMITQAGVKVEGGAA